jgi:hypothetical protein
MTVLSSNDDLRAIYRPARGGAVDKVIHRLDEHCANFLAKSPFMVLSTADADGRVDGSPKGGAPGFAQVIDELRVGWADSAGNNRLDSFENIVENPHVALLFMVPGVNETLRINGTGELSTDAELCERFSLGGKPARVVAVVTVHEAYIHCAKAFKRAELWDPESWLEPDELPNGVEMLRAHAAIDAPVEVIAEGYDADVEATLWKPGGTAPFD